MRGNIKTYLQEKKYGFIKGDDNKDYFFHISSLKDKNKEDSLCEGLYLEFEQKATPKGYNAINITIIDDNIDFKYEVPDNIISSKSSKIKDWQIIEYSDWIVIGSSRNSPDSARSDMLSKAKEVGANSLVNVEYFKTTGSEAGTGHGTHYYTVHNFRGQMTSIAKKSTYGKFDLKDFKNINKEASKLKTELEEQTKSSQSFKAYYWLAVLLILIAVWSTSGKDIIGAIILSVFLLFIGLFFIKSKNYDDWLEEI
ncbi:MAG TPA: cold shock domain-containing protein [Aliarcobacter thereius]|nr:cold shock domain-containing protein [Aliarcobacter thereius]HJE02781.1 cold shock domain-containing protein [Aliarcobacter thereius]